MGQHAAPMPHGEAYQPPLHQPQQQHPPEQGQPPVDGSGQQMGQDSMPPGQLPMVMPRNSAGEDVAAAALVNLVQVAHLDCCMFAATNCGARGLQHCMHSISHIGGDLSIRA